MAKDKKVPTESQLLIANLGNPHTPWPLVQPLLSFVPAPTRKPAIANPTISRLPVIISGESKIWVLSHTLLNSKMLYRIDEVNINPQTKAIFQIRDFLSQLMRE